MAYSDFTLPMVKQRLGLVLDEQTNLFAGVPDSRRRPGLLKPWADISRWR